MNKIILKYLDNSLKTAKIYCISAEIRVKYNYLMSGENEEKEIVK